jgi:hypothetical protein
MYRTELFYFILLVCIILASPYFPTKVLLLLDTIIVRVLIVVMLLYLITIGPTAGIFGFIAVAIMYLERNRRKVSLAIEKLDAMDVYQRKEATVKEAAQPQRTVPVKAFDEPDAEETEFVPDNSHSSHEFEPVAPSINQKAVLSSIYPFQGSGYASDSEKLYESLGVGHLAEVVTHH